MDMASSSKGQIKLECLQAMRDKHSFSALTQHFTGVLRAISRKKIKCVWQKFNLATCHLIRRLQAFKPFLEV